MQSNEDLLHFSKDTRVLIISNNIYNLCDSTIKLLRQHDV